MLCDSDYSSISVLCSCARKESASDTLREGEDLRATLLDALASGLTCIKMVLTDLARNELPVLGNFDAL